MTIGKTIGFIGVFLMLLVGAYQVGQLAASAEPGITPSKTSTSGPTLHQTNLDEKTGAAGPEVVSEPLAQSATTSGRAPLVVKHEAPQETDQGLDIDRSFAFERVETIIDNQVYSDDWSPHELAEIVNSYPKLTLTQREKIMQKFVVAMNAGEISPRTPPPL